MGRSWWRGAVGKKKAPAGRPGLVLGLPLILCCESGQIGVPQHRFSDPDAGVDPALAAAGVSLQRHQRTPDHVVAAGVLYDMTSEQRRTALNRGCGDVKRDLERALSRRLDAHLAREVQSRDLPEAVALDLAISSQISGADLVIQCSVEVVYF